MGDHALVWLPGLGGSPADLERAAGLLPSGIRVTSEVPGEGPVMVVGHSFGAVAALRFAGDLPARVEAAVLTGGFYPPARDGRSVSVTVRDYARHRALYARELAGRGRGPRPTMKSARRLALLARLGLHPGTFHTLADRVRCPLLVVHGALDHVVPVAFAHAAAARHPTWSYHECPEGGHFMHRDAADLWADVVGTWLAPIVSVHPR
jgi:pimeloyl-ACP methyl ester carboxylesterase